MIPGRFNTRPFVLVPLYIYPSPDSWEPLFDAARSYPSQEFIVVVNPDNGPGHSPAPDYNYLRALRELSALANVAILGYIYCSYGDRPLFEIEADIRVYGGWGPKEADPTCTWNLNDACIGKSASNSLRIDGVFVDEVPSEREYTEYLASITRIAKETLRCTRLDHAIIIYNPGIFVDMSFYKLADYIVVFENAASEWGSEYVRDNLAVLPPSLRSRSLAIAHSQGCIEEQRRFREDVVSAGFAGHFSTGMPGYTRFCTNWEDYVRDADGGLSKATTELHCRARREDSISPLM